MTSWNTGEMAEITKTNNNPQCPSTCHGSLIQFFVVNGELHIKHYTRSQDVMLGTPHNFVQYWALLTYFAFHSNLKVGSLTWVFGDAHIYNEESHIEAATQIIKILMNRNNSGFVEPTELKLNYNYSGELDSFGTPKFAATDFTIEGEIPKPTVLAKPKLL
jgi:thymidylate synthase